MAVLHASDGVSDPATTVLHARHVDSGLAGAMPAPGEAFPRREGDVPVSRDVVADSPRDGRRRAACACLTSASFARTR